MPGEKTYDFPEEFEENVARLVLYDRAFLLRYRRALDASWFRDVNLAVAVEAALTVFDASHGTPSRGSVLAEITKSCPHGVDKDEVLALARRLYDAGFPEDAGYVRDRVIDFGKKARLQDALAASGTLLEQGKYAEVATSVDDALRLSVEDPDAWEDYTATAKKRIEEYESSLARYIGTGIQAIDKRLQGGGIGPGEMGVIVGVTGGSKTNLLINIGYGALARGLRVFHATFEVSAVKTMRRYDARITQMPLKTVILNRAKALEKIHRFTGGEQRLLVKWWPGGSCTMRELEAHLRDLEVRKGFRPDLLIADYVAEMKPSGRYEFAGSRHAITELYMGFRGLCGALEVPGWTAIQANRDAYKRLRDDDVITEENAAEAFEPIRKSDVTLTTNQTKDEKREKAMRIHGAKIRDEASGWTESVRADLDCYTICDMDAKHVEKAAPLRAKPPSTPPPSRPAPPSTPPPPRRAT